MREPWMLDAACRGHTTETFFPHPGESHEEALAVCRDCPVVEPCLEYALTHHEIGVWGGTDAEQRRLIRIERRGACAST